MPVRSNSMILALAATLALGYAVSARADEQRKFASPQEAFKALVAAARSDDPKGMLAVLGPDGEEIVSSGDPVADKAARRRFAEGASARTRFETLPSGATIAHVGKDDWPLPIPIVKDGTQWRFDTAAGKEELLNRRIGRNELKAIDVCRVYVEAQQEHARREKAYAQKIRSEPGKHDGLYWDDPTGKNPSPLGPFLAEATAEGYAPGTGDPQPYHGYFYRSLNAQGAHAPGGAKSYVKDGQMTEGFALVAWPADPGSSGVMTFIVGPEGIVYQKNLGEQSAEVAKAMTAFDPDDSWTPVRD